MTRAEIDALSMSIISTWTVRGEKGSLGEVGTGEEGGN
jgi:hypothetical protein